MQQVADWLEARSGQYAQRFAENDITFAILPIYGPRPKRPWGGLTWSPSSAIAHDSRTKGSETAASNRSLSLSHLPRSVTLPSAAK